LFVSKLVYQNFDKSNIDEIDRKPNYTLKSTVLKQNESFSCSLLVLELSV